MFRVICRKDGVNLIQNFNDYGEALQYVIIKTREGFHTNIERRF